MSTTAPQPQITRSEPEPRRGLVAVPGRQRGDHPAGRGGSVSRDRRGTTTVRPQPTRPDPARLAGLLVRLSAEVAAGRRPLRQLEPLLAPTLARRLMVALRPGATRPQEEPIVRRVLAGPPTPSGAVEATVLIERGGRLSAVAVRLERHHGAWRATELTAPEAGYAPLPTRSSPRQERGPDAFDEAEAEAAAAADVTALVSRRRGSA